MYLDTDVILGLVKGEDWLKKHIDISKLRPAKTSSITIIEARIVLEREYSREEAIELLEKVKSLKVEIIAVDKEVIEKSQMLLKKYERLNNFDAIHAACAIVNNETLISTDTVYPRIEELDSKDPRKIG